MDKTCPSTQILALKYRSLSEYFSLPSLLIPSPPSSYFSSSPYTPHHTKLYYSATMPGNDCIFCNIFSHQACEVTSENSTCPKLEYCLHLAWLHLAWLHLAWLHLAWLHLAWLHLDASRISQPRGLGCDSEGPIHR